MLPNIKAKDSGANRDLPLFSRTIFVKNINDNIMSVSEAVDKGYTVVFDNNGVRFFRTPDAEIRGQAVLQGSRDPSNRLFYLDFADPATPVTVNAVRVGKPTAPLAIHPLNMCPVVGPNSSSLGPMWYKINQEQRSRMTELPCEVSSWALIATLSHNPVVANLSRTYHEYKDDYALWHPRLAHVNQRMAIIAKPDLKEWPRKMQCDNCIKGKFHKHPHSGQRPSPEDLPWAPGEYFTSDLFGPLLRSAGGARYAAFYIDLKSRFVM